jgi:hypothetical protein
MRRFWKHYKTVILAFFAWRVLLFVIELISPYIFALRTTFLNPVHWANMDGGHYLFIARAGYGLYEQAFFPFYPMLISLFSFLPIPLPYVGLVISHIAFFIGILLFYDLAREVAGKNALWSVVFLLMFPTSYYFAAVYSTSLFFLLSVGTFWAMKKHRWLTVGLCGAFASFTRIFGIFLLVPSVIEYVRAKAKIHSRDFLAIGLIPTGLFAYMIYLYAKTGDALSFIHVLPAYGSQRSAGQIILLPQVFWRYGKILFTASPTTIEYGVAVLEISIYVFFLYLVFRAFKTNLNVSYILYSAIVLIVPTLTGTLTSMPRYVLDAFPLFIVIGIGHNKALKIMMLIIMLVGLVVCTSLFLQGYFVA